MAIKGSHISSSQEGITTNTAERISSLKTIMAMYITSLFFFILCFFDSFAASPQTRPPRLHINLVHTGLMHAHQEEQRYISHIQAASIERLNYLRAKATGNIIAHITPLEYPPAFLANVSIGSPQVTQMLHMDTASDLLYMATMPSMHLMLSPRPSRLRPVKILHLPQRTLRNLSLLFPLLNRRCGNKNLQLLHHIYGRFT